MFTVPDGQDTDSSQQTEPSATVFDGTEPRYALQSAKSPNCGQDSLSTEYGKANLDSGRLDSSPAGSVYVDASHWTAILENISELKERVQKQDEPPRDHGPTSNVPETIVNTGPQLLFGCNTPSTKEALLSAMPDRSVVDRLMFDFAHEGGCICMCTLSDTAS